MVANTIHNYACFIVRIAKVGLTPSCPASVAVFLEPLARYANHFFLFFHIVMLMPLL